MINSEQDIYNCEEKAIAYFVKKRWGKDIKCPYCDSESICKTEKAIRFKCNNCNTKFTHKIGSILQGSNLPTKTCLKAMRYLGDSKKSIPSTQLALFLGVTQRTAWLMAHRIRKACEQSDKMLERVTEIEETYSIDNGGNMVSPFSHVPYVKQNFREILNAVVKCEISTKKKKVTKKGKEVK